MVLVVEGLCSVLAYLMMTVTSCQGRTFSCCHGGLLFGVKQDHGVEMYGPFQPPLQPRTGVQSSKCHCEPAVCAENGWCLNNVAWVNCPTYMATDIECLF